jgi:hypothetical protein
MNNNKISILKTQKFQNVVTIDTISTAKELLTFNVKKQMKLQTKFGENKLFSNH